MTNYIKLKDCLTLIPRHAFREANISDFLAWMFEGLKELPSITYTYPKVQIFEFSNYKLELDPTIKQINMVTYLANEPDTDCCNEFSACIENPTAIESDTTTNNICNYTINYKLFLDSTYFKKNYLPLIYKGTGDAFICSKCLNRFASNCAYTFTVDPNRVLHTTLESGFLCIDYDAELDCDNCLIPDYQKLKRYLTKYAMMRMWEERMQTKEETAFNYYKQYQAEAELAFKSARAEVMGRVLDVNTMVEVLRHTYRRLIQYPEHYVYAR